MSWICRLSNWLAQGLHEYWIKQVLSWWIFTMLRLCKAVKFIRSFKVRNWGHNDGERFYRCIDLCYFDLKVVKNVLYSECRERILSANILLLASQMSSFHSKQLKSEIETSLNVDMEFNNLCERQETTDVTWEIKNIHVLSELKV